MSAIGAKLQKLNVSAKSETGSINKQNESSAKSGNSGKNGTSENSGNDENCKPSSSLVLPNDSSSSVAKSSSSGSSDEKYIAQLLGKNRDDFRNEGLVETLYTCGQCLGTGGSSEVFAAAEKATGDYYAIKFMKLPELGEETDNTRERVLTEIDILASLQHETVVKLKEYFDTNVKIYVVTELLHGKDLINTILKRPEYSEEDARQMFSKLLTGIRYLHAVGIVHRDLKPGNLILKDPQDFSSVKIIDFGFAKKTEQKSSSPRMSAHYVAPEVLRRLFFDPDLPSTSALDLWSAGVILYEILGGYSPFEGEHAHSGLDAKLSAAILAGEATFNDPVWEDVTDAAKDLVSKLLNPDPDTGLTAKEALKHPWILGTAQASMQPRLKVTRQKLIELYLNS